MCIDPTVASAWNEDIDKETKQQIMVFGTPLLSVWRSADKIREARSCRFQLEFWTL